MQNMTTKMTDTPPNGSPRTSDETLGVNLSGGIEATVTAALGSLEEILCDISNEELKLSKGMAVAVQKSSEESLLIINI